MSVRWMRTIQIRESRFMEAIAWGKEVSAYAEKKYGTPKLHMWLDGFGAINTLRWTMDLPDLATVDKINAQLMMDPDYWKLIEKARTAQLFIDGSACDTVMRAL